MLGWQFLEKRLDPSTLDTGVLDAAADSCALKTSEALRTLFQQTAAHSPAVVSWLEGTDVKTGLVRHPTTTEDYEVVANTRFLLCATPALAQPAPETKTVVVWCAASCTSTPTHDVGRGMTEVVETLRTMRAEPRPSLASQLRLRQLATEPLGVGETGVARSVLVFEAMVAMSSDVIVAASAVAAQIDKRHAAAADTMSRGSHARAARSLKAVAACSEPHALNFATMPGVTPSNVFSIGLHLLEAARAAWGGNAPKQSLLAVPLAPQTVVDSPEYYEVSHCSTKTARAASLTCLTSRLRHSTLWR